MTKAQRLQIAAIADTLAQAAEDAAKDAHTDYLAVIEHAANDLRAMLHADGQ